MAVLLGRVGLAKPYPPGEQPLVHRQFLPQAPNGEKPRQHKNLRLMAGKDSSNPSIGVGCQGN
ncbi:MAG: hypothetical protein V2A79_00605, partial [Planctomycetota bacterium]